MRRVPLDKIQKGAKLGKSLFDKEGKILVREGTDLDAKKVIRLRNMGFESIYITDPLSDGIIEDMIAPELRIKSVKEVKNVFDSFDTYLNRLEKPSSSNLREAKKQEYKNSTDMTKVAMSLVSDLLNKKHQEINIVDIKNKDGYLYQHSVNVAVLSVIFGVKLGLSEKKLQILAVGSLLHDVGYNYLDYDAIKESSELTPTLEKMNQQHPQLGYDYLKDNMDINAHVRLIVLQHHEWMNGEGYPSGLKGKDISELVKIVAICDLYDTLISDSPNAKALDPQEATERMMVASVKQLDPILVSEFVKIIIPYPVGTVVRLTSNELGVVEEIDHNYPLRPKVKVVKQIVGRVELYSVDLMKEHNLLIDHVEYELPEECMTQSEAI